MSTEKVNPEDQDQITPEQQAQITAEKNEQYLERLRFHIKARKRRQGVSVRDYDDFAKFADECNDVIALELMLKEMGGFLSEREATDEDTAELHNADFNAEQRRRKMATY